VPGTILPVATVTETLHVSGVRCERCVMRLASALRDHDGIESANANLMGQVVLGYDDGLTSREAIVDVLSRAGFHELAPV
jgi:copper chaperone CopZ